MVHPQHSIPISDRSSIGAARRISTLVAERASLNEDARGRVPLIVTELATNQLLHARGGEILLRAMHSGVEIIALDRGPGIPDLQKCLADGFSSHGTQGCGLGAVRRLSSDFDIFSTVPAGTVVVSRVHAAGRQDNEPEFSAISLPAPGETECGDSWHLAREGGDLLAVVVDGLGHGPLAATAANLAVKALDDAPWCSPAECVEIANGALRMSRGAAIGVARAGSRAGRLSYSGIGNIAAGIVDAKTGRRRPMVSTPGIVGTQIRKFRQFEYPWQEGDVLLMHSDGLSERCNLSDYPGLSKADPAVIGATFYRETKRGNDDATVLTVRLGR